MTLLKVARQNKMIQICDDTKDLRLEQGVQLALFDLQPDGAKAFSILQSDLIKLVLTQNWKMSLECFQIVAQDTKNASQTTEAQVNPEATAKALVSSFEYEMCETFIKNC